MRAAMDAHDEVMRQVVEARGGHLFNHTGDGICAAFASPRLAVDAAVAAQRALELPVRMGIVTGEAETRGAEYSGTVLNRAARVMSAGHGGQILLEARQRNYWLVSTSSIWVPVDCVISPNPLPYTKFGHEASVPTFHP
jgi:class 3 adenylate cyclase